MSANITAIRVNAGLRGALGPINQVLDDDTVTDVLVNADGSVWVDRLKTGRRKQPFRMDASNTETVIKLLADQCGSTVTQQEPILSATLQPTGERIAGTLPPITAAPTLAIRKPPKETFALEAFDGEDDPYDGAADELDRPQTNIEKLRAAVAARKNIMLCGSTGSGKSSLASSLLSLPAVTPRRIAICEDTHELVTAAEDMVRFLTCKTVPMVELVRLCLRYRPDTVVIGEIRDGSTAMAYLGALNTGHSGGICTLHANSAHHGLTRLDHLCGEVCASSQEKQIRDAIDIFAYCKRTKSGRIIVSEVIEPN